MRVDGGGDCGAGGSGRACSSGLMMAILSAPEAFRNWDGVGAVPSSRSGSLLGVPLPLRLLARDGGGGGEAVPGGKGAAPPGRA